MISIRSRLALLLGAVTIALAPALLTAGPAQAAACDGDSGVTVVVQFPSGSISTGCAPGDPSSGLAALSGAGFNYVFQAQNPGFVCKINGLPSDGNCMKPDYWAYFHDTGSGWKYSSVGAGSYDPAPGTTEGWRFGTGSAPGVKAPKPTPSPEPSNPPAGSTGHSSSGTTSSASTSSTPTASATPTASTGPKKKHGRKHQAGATASASSSPSSNASTTAAAAGEQTTAPAADRTDSGQSLSWVWGVGLLAVAGAAAGVVALLRRRST